jgi:hypothetical protein
MPKNQVRLEITERTSIAGGTSFGDAFWAGSHNAVQVERCFGFCQSVLSFFWCIKRRSAGRADITIR